MNETTHHNCQPLPENYLVWHLQIYRSVGSVILVISATHTHITGIRFKGYAIIYFNIIIGLMVIGAFGFVFCSNPTAH
jgi:hypothetical protein